MQDFIKSSILIIFGFSLGWVAHMRHTNLPLITPIAEKETRSPSQSPTAGGNNSQLTPNNRLAERSNQEHPHIADAQQPTNNAQQLLTSFKAVLDAGLYDEAMEIYSEVKYHREDDAQKLKVLILETLNALLSQDLHSDFTALADAFLAEDYQDIDVLLLLAKFNQNLDYIEEAARVYQLALSYALNTGQRSRINQNLSEFVLSTDRMMSEKHEWWELQNFYFVLEESTLLKPNYQYRLAEVLIYNGDAVMAEDYLLKLLSHENLGDKARELLATLNEPQVPAPTDAIAGTAEGIPLQKFGDHYQIDVMLSGRAPANLLVDTGASLTSISKEYFDSIINTINARHVRSMMFNTAGGMTRGTVYRVDTIEIGPFVLEDVRIAVLSYKGSHGSKGLLGMNVLRHFKFQLNQDEAKLYLQKR